MRQCRGETARLRIPFQTPRITRTSRIGPVQPVDSLIGDRDRLRAAADLDMNRHIAAARRDLISLGNQ